jgi:hypothetical protein
MDSIEFTNNDYKDNYYEEKRANGYIFTKDRIKNDGDMTPCASPEGISWWSKKLGRYRTSKEQREFVQNMVKTSK